MFPASTPRPRGKSMISFMNQRRADIPIPKFDAPRGKLDANFGTEGHRQLYDSICLLNLNFATSLPLSVCEPQVRGTSDGGSTRSCVVGAAPIRFPRLRGMPPNAL